MSGHDADASDINTPAKDRPAQYRLARTWWYGRTMFRCVCRSAGCVYDIATLTAALIRFVYAQWARIDVFAVHLFNASVCCIRVHLDEPESA